MPKWLPRHVQSSPGSASHEDAQKQLRSSIISLPAQLSRRMPCGSATPKFPSSRQGKRQERAIKTRTGARGLSRAELERHRNQDEHTPFEVGRSELDVGAARLD